MSSTLLPFAVLAGVTVLGLLIGGILLFAFKTRPEQPGWQAATPGAVHTVANRNASGTGVWNALLVPPGGFGLSGRTFGTFHLEAGVLAFTPDGAAAPLWWAQCHLLEVSRRSFFSLDGSDLRIAGPIGEWHCSVSLEHINRFSRNTAKDFRKRQYAEQFVALLQWHGARASVG